MSKDMCTDLTQNSENDVPSVHHNATQPPDLWLILGDKLGDNRQVEIIAEDLGWPATIKRLRFLDKYAVRKPFFRASLRHVDLEHSSPLRPPWPDLMITVGRRPSMAALWVHEQSGGRSKIVIVGRPISRMKDFALVIAAPQYRLPRRQNVVHLDLPLIRVDHQAMTAAVGTWRTRLENLPRPLTAVFVGGPTRPYVFTPDIARDFMTRLKATTGAQGTIFVSTSRRTPDSVIDALAKHLPESAHLFKWTPDACENPYLALLGLADRFVVTCDSTSMIVEVARLGKPIAIYPLPMTLSPWSRARGWLAARIQPAAGTTGQSTALSRFGDILYEMGLISYSRDLSALHERLFAQKRATVLGDTFPAITTQPLSDDLPEVTERIRALSSS